MAVVGVVGLVRVGVVREAWLGWGEHGWCRAFPKKKWQRPIRKMLFVPWGVAVALWWR
jgi:hypothetical protein